MLDDLYFKWYYIKNTVLRPVAQGVLTGALVVLLWAGIVAYLVEYQLEAEDNDDADR